MNAKRCLITAAAVLLCAGFARADGDGWSDRWKFCEKDGPEAYPGNQADVDLFGTFANRDRFGRDQDRWGGGAGVDYFFTRYLGIGVDSYLEEWRWPYRVNGSGILRLPLQKGGYGWALYGFGGGGREFKYAPQYTYHGGGGVEFKFNRYVGLFGDYRRVFADKTSDYNLVRAGLSFGF